MFRACLNVLRYRVGVAAKDVTVYNIPCLVNKFQNAKKFSTLLQNITSSSLSQNIPNGIMLKSVLLNPKLQEITYSIQSRNVTKFSLRKGKRKSVKTVLKRFYRLPWGMWIRTKAGRFRQMWKKSQNRRRRLRQHVFTNSTQSYLLDKMVTYFWRKRKFWVDSPYEPYHTREEYHKTSMKLKDYWKD